VVPTSNPLQLLNNAAAAYYQCYDDDDDVLFRSDHFWLRLRNLVSWRLSETFGVNILTLYPKSKVPYNVTIYKGSNQAVLTRAFVLYFLYR